MAKTTRTIKDSERFTISDAIKIVGETDLSVSIVTEFGTVDITKKEAIRILSTCEADVAVISGSVGQLILEYPE
jgi:hypothetical protein